MRTSINVLGDAYGCGVVEHLSRAELKHLDDEAELEFAHMISSNQATTSHAPNPQGNAAEDPLLSVCDETQQIIPIHTSPLNFSEQPHSLHTHQHSQHGPHPPSVVVMDAVNKRSRNVLFNNSKLPPSVNSMPLISQFSNNNANTSNANANAKTNNGVNQDSNV